MDIAIALDLLIPAAEYSGSLTDNSQEAFDALVWTDIRAKPTWAEVLAADVPEPRQYVDIALVLDRIEAAGKQAEATALFDNLSRWDRERFYARTRLWTKDPMSVGLVQALNLDPDVILEPSP